MFINDKLATETLEGSSDLWRCLLYLLSQPVSHLKERRKYIWSPAVLTYGGLQMSPLHELHTDLPQSLSLMTVGQCEF